MIISKEKRRAAYQQLPEKIREYISSGGSIEKTDTLAQKFSLTPNQDIVLDDEITLVLMGLETKDDMLASLQEKTGIGKNKCLEIIMEADKFIFQQFKQWIPKQNQGAIKLNALEQLPQQLKTIKLPDGAAGSLPDHEEIIKNPIVMPSNPVIAAAPVPQKPEASKNLPPIDNLSWEERKKRAEEALKNIAPTENKKYPGGADPYREPIS